MALTKIPEDFQNVIKASSINTFGRAVEELVYNSIDAGATSVAVRVNVKDYFIQVIDNGTGVNPKDLKSMGKNYMTSKFENRLNTEPCYYGFRGQSIYTIVTVAQKVKITTRCDGTVETWAKEFISGIEHDIKQVQQRPSKGTTVEIKSFLYNAAIRRKAIEEINELNNIKSFLEKIAVVNTNLSLTFRNNANNEILLTIHKNRDVWQTLGLLNGIDINNIKELQVEKNFYKVKAYIVSNKVTEGKNKYSWIYLNRHFLQNCKIQNTFDAIMKKHLRFVSTEDRKSKLKPLQEETEIISNKKTIPSYFLFISCPRDEYDNSRSPKQSFLEFKNWDNLNKILEKLVKFYVGDFKAEDNANLKNIKENKTVNEDARSQVRKIIERVLGNKSKKSKISQLQNGVKGKYAKRKQKFNNTKKSKQCDMILISNDNKVLLNKQTSSEKTTTFQIKELQPDCATKLQKSLSISNKEKTVDKHCNALNNLKGSITKDNFLNSDKSFQENCAALKRKCDELEIIVDRILIRPKKKKLNKNSAIIQNNKVPNTKYTNIVRQENTKTVLRKNCKSSTSFTTNFPEYSPYFSKPIFSKIDETLSQFGFVRPIDKREKKLPNIGISTTPFTKNPFNLSFVESANVYSHQEFSLNTFQSHGFDIRSENYKQNIRKFISKQSIDNFGLKENVLYKKYENSSKRGFRYSHYSLPKYTSHNDVNIDLRTTASSYTIEFSKTNENINNERKSSRRENTDTNSYQVSFNRNQHQEQYFNTTHKDYNNSSPSAHKQQFMGNSDPSKSYETYRGFACNGEFSKYTLDNYERTNVDLQSTEDVGLPLTMHSTSNIQTVRTVCTSERYQRTARTKYDLIEKNNSSMTYKKTEKIVSTQIMLDTSDFNVVFVSETQQQHEPTPQRVNPVEMCEVLLNDTDYSPLKVKSNNGLKGFRNVSCQSAGEEDTYLHDSDLDNSIIELLKKMTIFDSFDHDSLLQFNLTEELKKNNERKVICDKNTQTPQKYTENSSHCTNHFKMKDRQRFLPKGMSPLNDCIAQHSKSSLRFDKEYFDSVIYFNFLDNLQTRYEIYEPDVQNMKTAGTKEIQNFEEKVIKDNASLVFTGKSLEKANILGQVDNKFIAAKIVCNNENKETSMFLVLFDQHAAHERIRLENNLLDYLEADKWKSVDIDNISLKLTKDEMLYLHNYRDKFAQFGLKWTSKNNFIIEIIGIPEAVLGKNPRQEDKIMLAVKEIITEVIKSLQTQRGCVPLYLKTVMDLVCSEACRYAIKFGDKLTINDCKELILDLSKCKTPFQCAHGRPVMAVLMELKSSPKREYSINRNRLLDFVNKQQSNGCSRLENGNFN